MSLPRYEETVRRRPAPAVALLVALCLIAAACGHKKHRRVSSFTQESPSPSPTPKLCPLTGVPGDHTDRKVLGLKVDAVAAARPPYGLNDADIVYEEPVESGLTRYLVIFSCKDSPRVEGIRSARLVDPDLLAQFGKTMFGNAGGIQPTLDKIKNTPDITDVYYSAAIAIKLYHRDGSRPAPHNLYVATKDLYDAVKDTGPGPQPIFAFSSSSPVSATAVASVHIPINGESDIFWKPNADHTAFGRYYGSSPANTATGEQISAANVVVQVVDVTPSQYVEDSSGAHQNLIGTVGTGRALVLRNGTVTEGTWSRPTLADITKYLDASGQQIPLTPGNTWIELVAPKITITVAPEAPAGGPTPTASPYGAPSPSGVTPSKKHS